MKRQLCSILLILLISIANMIFASYSHIAQADRLFKIGDIDGAIREYSIASQGIKNPYIYNQMAYLYLKQKRYDLARFYLYRAYFLDDTLSEIQNNITLIDHKIGKIIYEEKPPTIWRIMFFFYYLIPLLWLDKLLSIGVFILLTLAIIHNISKRLNLLFWIRLVFIFTVITLTSFVIKYLSYFDKDRVFIVSPYREVSIFESMKGEKQTQSILAGQDARVIEARKDYTLIQLPNGRRGWIANTNIKYLWR